MKFTIGWSVPEHVAGSTGGTFTSYVTLGKYSDVVSLSGPV